ncbi:MAG: hypothetical protein KBT27_04335 [Prevotellaceae bacterium]|nr:hypothetical protein [Candidatus Faecinaster equi]
MYYESNYLSHYGVLGMKWGVRRYQNKDGSLTSEGKKRRADDDRKDTIKKVAIGVGAAATVAAGLYFTNNYIKKRGAMTLKAGTEFQHMSRYVDEKLNKPFYASFLEKDNKKYSELDFALHPDWKTKMTFQSKSSVKIPSNKYVEKTYTDWLRSAKNKYPNANLPNTYRSFNHNLTSPDIYFKEARNDFYNNLSSKGYSAIRDLNDQANGVKAPIIYFGNLGDIKVSDIAKLNKI